ncbi:MAG TPA: DUF2207 domain-containing protein [Gammaproteobacteria bacterium]|nr:DUF2207 domain-containing protein [Gammaproteobacteria bacterium]
MSARARWLLCALALLGGASRADERILSFASDVRVEPDGGMEVTETLRVRAEGERIKHGIYRDFPTDYKDRLGNRYRVDFEVLSALRDGEPDGHREQRVANGVRVYLGRADYSLPPGEHEYELRYRTRDQLGFFADHDELYWNATGNGWDFPIDAASARVTLPAKPGLAISSIEGWVGPTGSTERAGGARVEDARTAFIESPRALGPREGLTFVATWPKGWIAAPTRTERTVHLVRQNLGLEVSLAGLLGVLLYLSYAWSRAGRDPEPGVIFPRYEPPKGFAPGAVRYVARMGYDNKAFSAALIDLAVKGHVDIDESGGTYTLRRRSAGEGPATAAERALLEALFGEHDRVVLENKNYRPVQKAMKAHKSALAREYARTYFLTNRTLLIPAVLIFAAMLTAVLLIGQLSVPIVAALALSAIAMAVFARLLKAPTQKGRSLLDEIEGFKLYLEVAEKDEINLRNPPEKTPELFEAYLPYALALAVEQPWAEKFARVFSRLEGQTGAAYQPAWYHGRWSGPSFAGNLGAFTSDMSHSFGRAIASASSPPGSSSGSGGGGSSGGGGGGGGGGGW